MIPDKIVHPGSASRAEVSSELKTPPCRVCGKTEWVAAYWPENPERAVCVECCGTAEHHDGETGHVWSYDRSERDRVCDHCGQFARNTDYYDHGDDW